MIGSRRLMWLTFHLPALILQVGLLIDAMAALAAAKAALASAEAMIRRSHV
jgi:hypothetical protein